MWRQIKAMGIDSTYPQTTGIKWTLNTVEPYDAKEETYPESTYHSPASIRRVTIESINGKP